MLPTRKTGIVHTIVQPTAAPRLLPVTTRRKPFTTMPSYPAVTLAGTPVAHTVRSKATTTLARTGATATPSPDLSPRTSWSPCAVLAAPFPSRRHSSSSGELSAPAQDFLCNSAAIGRAVARPQPLSVILTTPPRQHPSGSEKAPKGERTCDRHRTS